MHVNCCVQHCWNLQLYLDFFGEHRFHLPFFYRLAFQSEFSAKLAQRSTTQLGYRLPGWGDKRVENVIWCVDCVNWMLFIQDLATGQHWTNILVRSQIIHKEVWAMQNYRSFNIFRNLIISKQTHRSRSEYPNISIHGRSRLQLSWNEERTVDKGSFLKGRNTVSPH